MIEDLSIYFSEDGVTATWTPSEGGVTQTAVVLFDSVAGLTAFDGIGARNVDRRIVFQSINFIGLDEDEILTVSGQKYRVREVGEMEDGAMSEARLGAVPA